MNSFALLAWASLAASRTFLQWLLVFLNFTLDSEDLSFWHKRKKWFVWTTSVAQVAENHGDEWGLTWHFWWGIYSSILTWTHSQNSLAAAEVLSLKISSHGTSLEWWRRASKSHEISHKQCNKTWWIWLKINGKWDNNMIRISQWRDSDCITNTNNRRKSEIQKSRTVRIAAWGSE